MWRAEGMLLELTASAPAYAGAGWDTLRRRFTPSKKMYQIGDYIFEADDQSEFARMYKQQQKDGYRTGERDQFFKEVHWLLEIIIKLLKHPGPEGLPKFWLQGWEEGKRRARIDFEQLISLEWSERTEAPAEYKNKQKDYNVSENMLKEDIQLFNSAMQKMRTRVATADTPSITLVESTPSEDSTQSNTSSPQQHSLTTALQQTKRSASAALQSTRRNAATALQSTRRNAATALQSTGSRAADATTTVTSNLQVVGELLGGFLLWTFK